MKASALVLCASLIAVLPGCWRGNCCKEERCHKEKCRSCPKKERCRTCGGAVLDEEKKR